MKIFYLLTFLLPPLFGIGQKKIGEIYSGGTEKLYSELSDFLAEKENLSEDTVHIFLIQISGNKRKYRFEEKIKFQVFGKDSVLKELLFDFLNAHKTSWNYRKLKRTTAILPIYIISYRNDHDKIFVDMSHNIYDGVQENKLVYFIKPLMIQFYCCPSTGSAF